MELNSIVAELFLKKTNGGTAFDFYDYTFDERKLPEGSIVHGENCFHKNLSLRHSLHHIWVDEPERRNTIAKYYVKSWGGIQSINDQTLQHFVQVISAGISPMNKGIASWSKITTLSNPAHFAIFDARVAATLNCIQIKNHCCEYAFPCLPSQNSAVNHFTSFLKTSDVLQAFPTDDSFYQRYLSLLREASAIAGTNIQHIEMLLYAISINEINEVLAE